MPLVLAARHRHARVDSSRQPGMRWSANSRSCRTRSCTRCTRPDARRRDRLGAALSAAAWQADALVGAMPLYAKTHSYGEYVFDWAWADAYRRHGRRYYPKLVAAIPFTPVTGPRLLAADADSARRVCSTRALAHAAPTSASRRCTCCSRTPTRPRECAAAGMLMRDGLQFHWQNPGYRDFADFLATFNHDKRKKIRQERRKLAEAGVTFVRQTRRRHHARRTGRSSTAATQHLSRSTARRRTCRSISSSASARRCRTMSLLVIGSRARDSRSAPRSTCSIAARCGDATGARPATCRACTSRPATTRRSSSASSARIGRFEGGAQGVHKLARGLLPVTTHSAHAIADPEFAARDRGLCRARARRRRADGRRARAREPVPARRNCRSIRSRRSRTTRAMAPATLDSRIPIHDTLRP